ncbi:hypothetical protein C8R43DRAFT_597633 [Mycena crocata]|nr:hypothetical protein C8R43DRAFT_597633 [Mycena crocata]
MQSFTSTLRRASASVLRSNALFTSTTARSTLRLTATRAMATEAAAKGTNRGPRYRICMNCRREGHTREQCTEPTVCVACGVEGHERKNCPSPDPARLEALNSAPLKCFRCGVEGHTLKECKEPAKCFNCGAPTFSQFTSGETSHLRSLIFISFSRYSYFILIYTSFHETMSFFHPTAFLYLVFSFASLISIAADLPSSLQGHIVKDCPTRPPKVVKATATA